MFFLVSANFKSSGSSSVVSGLIFMLDNISERFLMGFISIVVVFVSVFKTSVKVFTRSAKRGEFFFSNKLFRMIVSGELCFVVNCFEFRSKNFFGDTRFLMTLRFAKPKSCNRVC